MSTIYVQPAPTRYAGQIVPLLSVWIDDHLVSHHFPPFDASATSIGASVCLECFVGTNGKITCCGGLPEGQDSHDDFGIRRHGNQIVWFRLNNHRIFDIWNDVPSSHMWQFEITEYESQLGGDSTHLPDFTASDIQRVIRLSNVPKREDSIYRIPLCELDPMGRKLLKLIQGLTSDDGLEIAKTPTNVITYEIGMERNCEPEVTFDVGIDGGRFAIRLHRNPTFQYWISSAGIDEQLARIAE